MENFEIEENKNDNLMSKRKQKKTSTYLFTKIIKIVLIISLIIMIFIVFFFIYNKNKKSKNHYIVLVGDIGGIHARLRLLNITSDINIKIGCIKYFMKIKG